MKNLNLSYFLTGVCTGSVGQNIDSTQNEVSFNGDIILKRVKKNVFIWGQNVNETIVCNVLTSLGYTASFNSGMYNVNGLEWDGSKVNINLFD